jgi:hypothetical protein
MKDDIVERLCREVHERYEEAADVTGWHSQTPLPWENVPEANKETMRRALKPVADEIERLTSDNERLLALCGGRQRVVELKGHKPIDFDEVCARVSAHEYQALDLEIIVGFAQGAFDEIERLEESLAIVTSADEANVIQRDRALEEIERLRKQLVTIRMERADAIDRKWGGWDEDEVFTRHHAMLRALRTLIQDGIVSASRARELTGIDADELRQIMRDVGEEPDE